MNFHRLRLVDLVAAASGVVLVFVVLTPHALVARAAARAASCRDNFRTIGLALQNYHAMFQVFPPGRIWEPDPQRPPQDDGAAAMFLPFLEQDAVFSSCNFDLAWIVPANKTTRNAKLAVFLCPEDKLATITAEVDPSGQPTNVAFSLGSQAWSTHPGAGKGPKPEGVFFDNSNISIRDITDGTSYTILASEQLIDRIRLDGSAEMNNGECAGELAAGEQFYERSGTRWITGDASSAYFNARRLPNHAEPDCFHGNTPGGIGFLNKVPRSGHDGGVHVLLGDGGVRFLLDGFDAVVWQALNTRAGGEKLGEKDF